MTTYKFKNMKQFNNTVNKFLKNALDEVADQCFLELKASVSENIYSWTPSKYKRTKEVLDSITRTRVEANNGRFVVKIYFDTDKIQPHVYNGSAWNAHADFRGNTVDGRDILNWLENGTDNEYYSHPAYKFFSDTIEWLYGEMDVLFKKALQNNGFTV